MPIFFTVQTIPTYGYYMVIPVTPDNKEDPNHEYVFTCERKLKAFCDYYRKNPFAACFAYANSEHNTARMHHGTT